VRAEPAMLEIVGPRSHVSRVESVATDAIDVSGAEDSAQFRVSTFVTDPYVRFAGPPSVTATVTLKRQ